MPELPDVELYVARLAERLVGQPLQAAMIWSPFVLRTVTPAVADFIGVNVTGVSRIG